METNDDYYDYYEEEEDFAYSSCPKCGRWYDEIGYDLQYCKACGWDVELKKFGKGIEPTEDDYLNGDADILTGRWY